MPVEGGDRCEVPVSDEAIRPPRIQPLGLSEVGQLQSA